MENLTKDLRDEYLFYEEKLQEEDKKDSKEYITVQEVLKGYFIIVDYFSSNGEVVAHGIKDFNLIGSAVDRQWTSWNGKMKWNTVPEIAATLFYGLNKNHAFIDGNKRTALLMMLYFIIKRGYMIQCPQKDFETLAVRTAANELNKYSFYKKFKNDSDVEIRVIAQFIKNNIRKADKRFYSITYQELETKLAKYGYYFVQNTNYVKICHKVKRLWKTKEVSVIQTGFPGLKKQVNTKAFKEIIKACEKDFEHGYDMQLFFEGNESMYKLINDYEGAIKRLKDK